MTLVYPPGTAATSPAIHALVLGVGAYPHLPGGKEFPARRARYTLGLKQLSSPPVSAERLANWLIANLTGSHRNPKAPLGSVELLLSPADYTDPAGTKTRVDEATFANARAAFEGWLRRCDGHEDNIGLFYYCGHGFEWGKPYLLASDYGASQGSPWENLIDFNISRIGFLGDCKARTLCCFLDACREVNIDLIRQLNVAARPLWDAGAPPAGDRDAPVFQATRPGEKAHADPGQVSYFTAALVRCLERLGAAGPPSGGAWQVTTSSLGQAMRQLMRRTLIPNVGPGVCHVGGESNTPEPTVLHHLPGTAAALAEVTYDPEDALRFAELSYCLAGSGAAPEVRRPAVNRPWQIEVPAGTYDVAARFPGGEHGERQAGQVIHPPFTRCAL